MSNDSPAAKRPRSSEESQTSPEIEGKIELVKEYQMYIEAYTFVQEFADINHSLLSR